MTHQRDLDGFLRDYLAEGTNELADRVIAGALEQIDLTEQRRASRAPWRFPPMYRTLRALGAVAVVAVLVIGGAYLVQRGLTDVGNASPSPEASATPSEPPIVTLPTPSPTAAALSLDLTWTELDLEANLESGFGSVAWVNDRFVLLEDGGAIRTSTDGATWSVLQPGDPDPGYAELLWGRANLVAWDHAIVGWWNPEDGPDVTNKPPITARDVLRIVRPPAAPVDTTPFKGRIESIGIGPAGIVAQVHSHIDTDAFIASRLGENWVSHYTGVDFRDGVLDVGMDNGPGLHVVWADEGFELGDYFDAGFGWYSPDGVEWTAMPTVGTPEEDFRGFATGFGDVVGVSDGFIARGVDTECTSDLGCAGMWFSADGLTWTNIGNVPGGYERSLVSWRGGALLTDGVGSFDLWTSDGPTELPMAEGLPAVWTQADPQEATYATGPLGFMTVLKDSHEILVSWDGVDSKMEPMPAAMAAGSTLFYGSPNVVVGDRSVLVVVWSGSQEARIPTFWVGTPTP